jgi:tRNA1(Val) A37 N6-methylase TrmN6
MLILNMSSARTDPSLNTTCDAFLDGRLNLLQPRNGPRAAIDALFLAASIPAEEGQAQAVLEAGTGTGIASLALCSRVNDCLVTGVDVQSELLALARENVSQNGFEDRITLIEADITASGKTLEAAGLARESFHHVVANPPFFTSGKGQEQADASTARAYTAQPGDLEKWIKFLNSMAAPKGTLTLIHRAEALEELLALLKGRFGALVVYPLFPKKGVPAKRVLVQGIKGSRAPLELLPGMVLHGADGCYTKQANLILRDGAGLGLRPQA